MTCGDVSTVTSHQLCLLAQKRGSSHREEQGQVPLYRCTVVPSPSQSWNLQTGNPVQQAAYNMHYLLTHHTSAFCHFSRYSANSDYHQKKRGKVQIRDIWGAFAWPFLHWKSNKCQILRVCVCSLSYPACNAHARRCCLEHVRLYRNFPNYLKNSTIFVNKIMPFTYSPLVFF